MELLQYLILVGLLRGFFVECDEIRYHLRVFALGVLWDATLVDEALPFFRKTLDDGMSVEFPERPKTRVRREGEGKASRGRGESGRSAWQLTKADSFMGQRVQWVGGSGNITRQGC